MSRRLGPSATLALAILLVNVAGLAAFWVGGEAVLLPMLALVGVGDITIAVLTAMRGLSGLRHLDPIRLSGAALAMTLIAAWFAFWGDPILAVGRLLSQVNGQEIGEGFIAAYSVLWAFVCIAAIASVLRGDRRSN